jgi:plastocyanin
MRFASTAVISTLFTALSASAAIINVTVGANGLTYEPSSVTAQQGDQIAFQFVAKNHTVTQSTFDAPCTFKADGVNSGYQFVAAGATSFPVWTITVNNASAPLWFYCAQGAHCQNGMVFAVNPTADRTFEQFRSAAAAATSGAQPPAGNGTTPSTTSTTGTGTGTSSGSQPSNTSGAASARSMSALALSLGSLALGALLL